MCLTVDKEFKTRQAARDFFAKPLIAKTNKTVYKVLKKRAFYKHLESPFQQEKYEPGELKTVPKFGKEILKNFDSIWRININNGIHACTSLDQAIWMAERGFMRKVIKCYIPKGTPYFIGTDGDIVSLALQMPKKFKHIYL